MAITVPIVQRGAVRRADPEIRRISAGPSGREALAAGIERAGRGITSGLGRLGDAAEAETRKQQSSIVMEAWADLADKDLALRTGYSAQKGKNVLQAGETVLTNFDEIVSSIKGSISNQEALDAFSAMASDRKLQFKTYVNTHTNEQLEVARTQNATAAVDAATDTAVFEALAGNSAATAQAIAEGEAMLRGFKVGSLLTDGEAFERIHPRVSEEGIPTEFKKNIVEDLTTGTLRTQQVDALQAAGVADAEEIAAYRSQAHASVLSALINDGQAKQAELYFEANKGDIEAKPRAELDAAVSAAGRRVDAQANVADIWESNLDDNGEIDVGAAIEELDSKSSEMHPQTFEKTREGLIAKGKEQKALNRASDTPHIDTLKLGFQLQSKRFGPGDPDFDVLSTDGKVKALSWLAAETRGRRTASRAARQWQNELDKDAEARWDALDRIDPEGNVGTDQLTIDIDEAFPDARERQRNKQRKDRRRLEEKMRKDGGESEKAFARDLDIAVQEFDLKANKKGVSEDFEKEVFRLYDEWQKDDKNRGKDNPTSKEIKGMISEAIEIGQERVANVPWWRWRKQMRRFEARAARVPLEFPNSGAIGKKNLEEAVRLEQALGRSGPTDPAVVRPGAPASRVILTYKDPGTGEVIREAVDGDMADQAREALRVGGFEVLN